MANWRSLYAAAVKLHGANAVAKATGIPRQTILSVVACTARSGNDALAELRVDRLASLSNSTPPTPRAA